MFVYLFQLPRVRSFDSILRIAVGHTQALTLVLDFLKIFNPPLIVPTTKDYADGFSNPFLSLRDRTTQY